MSKKYLKTPKSDDKQHEAKQIGPWGNKAGGNAPSKQSTLGFGPVGGSSSYSSAKTYEVPKRCYHSHPPLKIGAFTIYGGSCIEPAVTDADIYIGFDYGMRSDNRGYPWNPGESFLFPITDMSVPKDVEQFNKLLDWIVVQLTAQKKVHMGCIGGHGRTGLVLAALVRKVMGTEDAITYVRENYCQKAVESDAQITFLNQHYGIKKVHGSKSHGGSNWGNSRTGVPTGVTSARSQKQAPVTPITKEAEGVHAHPARHPMSVWGQDFKRA